MWIRWWRIWRLEAEWGCSSRSCFKTNDPRGKGWGDSSNSSRANSKPQKALQLGLNVLIDSSCEGDNCYWHEFPYEAKNIVSGLNDEIIKFNNKDDVLDYIQLLKKESEEHRGKGNNFSTLNNVYEQLPFFCCNNNILDSYCQKDISRYIYSIDTNTQPYRGS